MDGNAYFDTSVIAIQYAVEALQLERDIQKKYKGKFAINKRNRNAWRMIMIVDTEIEAKAIIENQKSLPAHDQGDLFIEKLFEENTLLKNM